VNPPFAPPPSAPPPLPAPEHPGPPADGASPGRNWLVGCLVAALAVSVFVILVLAVGATGFIMYYRDRAQEADDFASAPMTPDLSGPGTAPAGPVPAEDGAGQADAGGAEEGEEEEDACVVALPVLVKLAGVNDKGEVRYLLDRTDEVAGEAALGAALRKRLEAEKTDPQEDLPLIVDLDVATAAGITQAQVDAAVKACWQAGAAVLPPPDLSKEARK